MSDPPAPATFLRRLIGRIGGPFANIARALNDPVYGPYAFGNFVSVCGIWVQRLGVGWLTWELTESPGWLGAVAFANLFPLAVLAPLAGAAADRWNTLNLVRLSNWLIALQSLVMLALVQTGHINVAWIMILTVILGMLMALNQPARLAIVPTLVTREHLPAAIAIGSLSYNGGQFIGPAMFAFLIPVLGVSATFVFQAVSFVIFGVVLIWTKPRSEQNRKKSESSLFGDMRDGFVYSWNHVGLLPVLTLLVGIALGTRPVADLFAAFADHVFSQGEAGYGLLTAAIGTGAIFGILIFARRTGTKGLVDAILIYALGTCAAVALFVATDVFWVGMLGAFCLGFTYMPVAVGAQTLMQSGVDPAMRGRVMALYVSLWRSMPAVGALVMGYASEYVGLRWPPVVGILIVLAVVAWLWVRRRAIAAAIEPIPEEEKPA